MDDDDDRVYQATKALFSYIDLFDAWWNEGWRPEISRWRDIDGRNHQDIIFRGPCNSYVRESGHEQERHDRKFVFDTLFALL